MEDIAPMVVAITFIVVTGGVALLFPLSRKLGILLEAMAREKHSDQGNAEVARLRDTVSSLESRLALLEERQNFSEALLTTGRQRIEITDRERQENLPYLPAD